MASMQTWCMQCSSSVHYASMKTALEKLCRHTNFVIECLVPTRSKKIGGGKCCWSAYYRCTNGSIASKKDFNIGRKAITLNKPFFSEVVAFGRFGEATYGIFVQYMKTDCACALDFSYLLTPFPMEQRNMLILFRESQYINDMLTEDELEDNECFRGIIFKEKTLEMGWTAVGIKTLNEIVIAVARSTPLTKSVDYERPDYVLNNGHWFAYKDNSKIISSVEAIPIIHVLFDSGSPIKANSMLFAGFENGDPQLWHLDSTLNYINTCVMAIGFGSKIAEKTLKENYTENMSIQEAVNLSMKSIKEAIGECSIEINVATREKFNSNSQPVDEIN